MNFLVLIWDNIKDFFLKNTDWIEHPINILAQILVALGLLGGLIFFIIQHKRLPEDVKNARKKLKNQAIHTRDQIKLEPLFFNEPHRKLYFFFRKFPVYFEETPLHLKKILKKSYLLTGTAGCGKSSLLKYDYIRTFRKKIHHNKTALIYLNSDKMINILNDDVSDNKLITFLKVGDYKNIYLYLDGIDEIGNSLCPTLYKLINNVYAFAPNVKLKVSSRPEFAQKYIERNDSIRVQRYLKICTWSSDMLKSYAVSLLKQLYYKQKCNKKEVRFIIEDIINKSTWNTYITSPLLMKLFLYLKLENVDTSTLRLDNRYNFYNHFITSLIKSFYRNKNEQKRNEDIQRLQNDFANIVFTSFCKGEKNFTLPVELDLFLPILKEVSSPPKKVSFIHETFFEYFIAKHYLSKLSCPHINQDIIAVFHHNYTNDYADFITDALKAETPETKQCFFEKFCKIYYYTLDTDTKPKYNSISAFPKIQHPYSLAYLTAEEFFSLKYEIITRLGRLDLCNSRIIEFLNFIYLNDTNTKQDETFEYYIAVLKRCCAISSSFLANEKIELDYITHMLPFLEKNYIKEYDLANRTHTLLFYGDIINKNIFNFRDEDPMETCKNAFHKRIERLSTDLPTQIKDMNKKETRKYFFRLFDLATIYTFMHNRNRVLTSDEYRIVSNCFIDFVGASTERKNMMTEIKKQILILNQKLKESIK